MADGSGTRAGADARLHLLKLCVGAASVEDLAAWQTSRAAERRRRGAVPCPVHVTRMWPRREAELLDGGSIYWVIGGLVAVRQRILALEPADLGDTLRRCALVFDPELVRTEARPMRPFQGWRYLAPEDAPPDLGAGDVAGSGLPASLEAALGAIGVRPRPGA